MPPAYDEWIDGLARLARDEGLEWLVDPASSPLQEAWRSGVGLGEQLAVLRDLGQWRGCGCGGGGS